MSKIVSISTALPSFRHKQKDILGFMQNAYAMNEAGKRKLQFLYRQSAIESRYSVLPDYSVSPQGWQFYPPSENLEPFPDLELRMKWYDKMAPVLSVNSIEKCINQKIKKDQITHLITVSCTGMSAPGLDLQIMEMMNLPNNMVRSSVNFMGCYAAVHAMKLANAFCKNDKNAKVIVVCTELCTLHFQKEMSEDNITSGLLFGDGSSAILVLHDHNKMEGLQMKNFYSEVDFNGKDSMSWQLSSSGFLMKLSGYVPLLMEQDFIRLFNNALQNAGMHKEDILYWCIHPGGKRVLSAIEKSVSITEDDLKYSYKVLNNYGNMSSPTILFVLKEIMEHLKNKKEKKINIFGAAFGPGLTMETFILSDD